MIIVSVSGNAIAEERVVFEVDKSVGWIVSTDATLAIALLVAGSARKRARKFRRRELRADPANSNAGHGRPYPDEAEVAAAIEDLAAIESGIPRLEAETGAPVHVQTRRIAGGLRVRREFSAQVTAWGSTAPGLWLGAYGGAG